MEENLENKKNQDADFLGKSIEANTESAKNLSSIIQSLEEDQKNKVINKDLISRVENDSNDQIIGGGFVNKEENEENEENEERDSKNQMLENIAKNFSDDRKAFFDDFIKTEEESNNKINKEFLGDMGKNFSDDRKAFFDDLVEVNDENLNKINNSIEKLSTTEEPSRGEEYQEELEKNKEMENVIEAQESFATRIANSFSKITEAITGENTKVSLIAKIALGILILGTFIYQYIGSWEKAKELASTILNKIWEGIKWVANWIYEGIASVGSSIDKWLQENIYASIVRGLYYVASALNILKWAGVIKEASMLGKILGTVANVINGFFGIFGKIALMLSGISLSSSIAESVLYYTDDIPEKMGAFQKTAQRISKVFSAIVKAISKTYNTIFGWSKLAMDIGSKISSATGKVISSAISLYTKFVVPVINFFNKAISAVKTTAAIFPRVTAVFVQIGSFLGKIFGFALKIFRFTRLLQTIPVLGQILSIVFTTIDAIIGFAKGFFGEGGSLLNGIKGAIAQIISGLSFGFLSFDTINEFITPLFDALGSLFSLLYDTIMSPFKAIFIFFGDVWDIIWDSEKSIMEKIWAVFEAIGRIPLNIINIIWTSMKNVGKVFSNAFGEGFLIMVDFLKELPSMIWGGITGWISSWFGEEEGSVPSGEKGIFEMSWDYVTDIVSKLFKGLKFIYVDVPLMIWDHVKKIPGMIFGALKFMYVDFPLMIWGVIKDLLNSIIPGAGTIIDNAISWISDSIFSLVDEVKNIGLSIWNGLMGLIKGVMASVLDYVPNWLIPQSVYDFVYGSGDSSGGENSGGKKGSSPMEEVANDVSGIFASEMSTVTDGISGVFGEMHAILTGLVGGDVQKEEEKGFFSKLNESVASTLGIPLDEFDNMSPEMQAIAHSEAADAYASQKVAEKNKNLRMQVDPQIVAMQHAEYKRQYQDFQKAQQEQQQQQQIAIARTNNNNIVNNNVSSQGGGGKVTRRSAAVDPASSRLRSRHIVT